MKPLKHTVKQRCTYSSSGNTSPDDIRKILNKHSYSHKQSSQESTIIYYDSFDWRLYHENFLLYRQQHGQQFHLQLESPKDGSLISASVTELPRFAWQLADSLLRKKIAAIIETRALFPVAEVKSHATVFKVTDDLHKTIFTVTLQHDVVGQDKSMGSRHKLSPRIILEFINGSAKQYQKFRKVLKSELKLKIAKRDRLSDILYAQGRTATDYSAKLHIKLDPRTDTANAARKILTVLLRTLLANEEGVKSNIDSEFLHDYRVAVRRTRSVLAQLKGALPDLSAKHFLEEFSWLGENTSPLRDLDVHIQKFAAYNEYLGDEQYAALASLKSYLSRQRKNHYKALLDVMNSSRYQQLLSDWDDFLNEDTDSVNKTHKATRPIKETADEQIWRVYRKVTMQAKELTMESPAEEFHALRKRCKKLRYLLEVFQNLYTQHDIRKLIKHLKILQENLGEFQDLAVQVAAIIQFIQQMEEQGMADTDTVIAAELLTTELERKKYTVHGNFIGCYAQFSKADVTQLFKQLFDSPHLHVRTRNL